MEEASRKKDNRPDFISTEPWATAREEISKWSGPAGEAGDEDLPLDQEQDVELPHEASPADWQPDEVYETGLTGAGAGDGDPADEPVAAFAGEMEPPFDDKVAGGDGEETGQMWSATVDRVPFYEHALYVEAMQALAAGKGAVVAANLRELAELYPDEPGIQDLLVRMELKSAVAQERELPAEHRQAAPALQSLVTFLLVLTVGLAGVAAFYVAFNKIVAPRWEEQRRAAEHASLKLRVDGLCAGSDWNGCIEGLRELQQWEPDNEDIPARIAYAERQIQLSNWYADALTAEDAGDLTGALALYQQIEEAEPGYGDVARRIQNLQTLLALERDWLEAESLVQAEDWEAAKALLLDIRRRDPEYRAEQVRERLFRINELQARDALSRAGGSVERVREALVYLQAALAERPTDRELTRQRTLALSFVNGFDAEARGDWLEAVKQWEAAYELDPGYQGGVLEGWLTGAYPSAARQAIANAAGSVERLELATVYLDRALQKAPEDEGLQQERLMVSAYLDGARAYEAGFWNQAIRHWGPLYAVAPGYQNGVLEASLRQACGSSPDPDLALCPP